MLISITLENYFPQELAKEIVEYIKKKKIQKIKLVIEEELKNKVNKIYISNMFKELQTDLENYLVDDGFSFFLEIPVIKTSFEKFTYGVEANSYEKDFKDIFSKYV